MRVDEHQRRRRRVPARAGAVCKSCGLCCDGTLFDVVYIPEDEPAPSPLVVLRDDAGARSFRQCCPALDVTSCGVYEDRPSTCRRFECLLVESVSEGDLDVDSALEIVARARALVAATDAVLHPEQDASMSVMRRARRAALDGVASEEHRAAEAWLELHFLGRPHPSAPGEGWEPVGG